MSDFDFIAKESTKTKLHLIESVFKVWITIWQKQKWAANDWYVLDLFAGKGFYETEDGEEIDGSFIIFLNVINSFMPKIKSKGIKIHLFGIEKNKKNFQMLKKKVNAFKEKNKELNEYVEINIYREDCNKIIDKIISTINSSPRNPLFALIDPPGLQMKMQTMKKIVSLKNPRDIFFNYILEGVRRTSGVASKMARGKKINNKEAKTVHTLKEFLGSDIDIIKEKRPEDLEILHMYANLAYADKGMCVVGYNVEYPDRDDDLYYLLFASKNSNVTKIVKDIFARKKEKTKGLTLFGGKDFYLDSILEICPLNKDSKSRILFIKRKSLLYKTKVEYGNWTVNHIIGCAHGCKFPCYAMMLAKRFGWIKDYDDWRVPRIAENALEILQKEIPKYREKIDFVHLSFMTDPFMYDHETGELFPEVKELTLKIISLFNENGIRVTTLTKGFYPNEILYSGFLEENEYGITLVSLNKKFKERFEPFSAPYERRVESLYKLHKAGLKTWVSIEPYPTPNLDETAENIEELLNKIKFVDKIIFGKINYNVESKYFENKIEFYQKIAKKVIEFCDKHNIKYHIKFGTPHSKNDTKNIFLV